MFFWKIRGLRREGDYIYISGEYHRIRFHIHEIGEIRITDASGLFHTAEELPIRNARIVFHLKSGRKKTCYVRKLTLRKYGWLQKLLESNHKRG